MVEGYLPLSAATEVTALADTTAVVAAPPGGTDAGSVLAEGDAAEHGPQARGLGASGAGVKVGVMSDSINEVGGGIAESQGSGDLPTSWESSWRSPAGHHAELTPPDVPAARARMRGY